MAPFQIIFFEFICGGEYFCGRMPRLRIIFGKAVSGVSASYFRLLQRCLRAACRLAPRAVARLAFSLDRRCIFCWRYVTVYIMHERTKRHSQNHTNSTLITQLCPQHCAKHTAYENVSNHGGSAEATQGCGTASHVFNLLATELFFF